MPRGKCEFETMMIEKSGVSPGESWWSKHAINVDPFDPTRGYRHRLTFGRYNETDDFINNYLLNSPVSGMSDDLYKYLYGESQLDTRRATNKYKRNIRTNPTKDIVEEELENVYVTPEEAFGNKSIDIGDSLNKAFD